MVLLFPLIALLSIVLGVMGEQEKIGACFMRKTTRGCKDFIALTSRKQCCEYQGYFVRKPDAGHLFISALLNVHNLPNCENPCTTDYCEGKRCGTGHTCIMRDNDSICTSDCKCTEQQRQSGPICVREGPKYRNMCDLHLRECWTNTKQKIIPCQQSGCQKRKCGKKECVLTLKGRAECLTQVRDCDKAPIEPLCGVNNVTYSSYCSIKQAGILRKREIHIAYKGNCRATATCSNVECPEAGMSCVKHHRDASPVCVKCPESMDDCQNSEFQSDELFCLSIRRQSQNTCFKDFLSCQNNVFIEIIHSGMCLQITDLKRQTKR